VEFAPHFSAVDTGRQAISTEVELSAPPPRVTVTVFLSAAQGQDKLNEFSPVVTQYPSSLPVLSGYFMLP
jgi:hypothetical protein